jgi:hypothetical protein
MVTTATSYLELFPLPWTESKVSLWCLGGIKLVPPAVGPLRDVNLQLHVFDQDRRRTPPERHANYGPPSNPVPLQQSGKGYALS